LSGVAVTTTSGNVWSGSVVGAGGGLIKSNILWSCSEATAEPEGGAGGSSIGVAAVDPRVSGVVGCADDIKSRIVLFGDTGAGVFVGVITGDEVVVIVGVYPPAVAAEEKLGRTAVAVTVLPEPVM
jgi:hypothetical protein